MAETLTVPSAYDTTTVAPSRLSWSAVFGGAVFAVGVWLLLHLLGMGIGLTTVDPNHPNTLRGAGIGSGIGSLFAPLIALFVGGLVAARVATTSDRVTGAIHGAIVWALTILFGAALLFSAASAIIGSVAQVSGQAVGAVAETAGRAIQGGGADQSLQSLGVDENALIQPVNQRLAQQGLPPMTAQQLEQATRDALRSSVQQGRFDRETIIRALDENTAMSRSEAERATGDIESGFNQRVTQLGQSIEHGAAQVADTTGTVMLWTFAGLLLGLIASVLGAVLGQRQRVRYDTRIVRERPTTIIADDRVIGAT
jgi:hypothetical protein